MSASRAASQPGPRLGYGRGTAILAAGLGATGLITFGYFSLASYALSEASYGEITLLWSAVFIAVSVLYRPVEQLISRTVADRDARGHSGREHLRVAAVIQATLALVFTGAALALRGPLEDGLFDGSEALYRILVITVIAYAASYFARGFLAGHHRFGLYGVLVLVESSSRVLFALAVVVGVASGQSAVALGIVAAPIVSLAVVPWALRRRERQAGEPGATRGEVTGAAGPTLEARGADGSEAQPAVGAGFQVAAPFTLSHGTGFALAVLAIVLSEQAFLNAGPLLVKATEGAAGTALAGFAFNVLLIARAPLQLFQAVQTSILPHLTRLRAVGERGPFQRSVNLTLAGIAGFTAVAAVIMLSLGPELMGIVFGGDFRYERGGLLLITIGMGLHLGAATLSQAALARARQGGAAICWVIAAATFVALLLLPADDRVLQVEVSYATAALVLCALLYRVHRRGDRGA